MLDAPVRFALVTLTGTLSQVGPPGEDITGVITLVTQIGLSAIFLWQWRDERSERRTTQAAVLALTERSLVVLHEAADVLEDVRSSLGSQIDKASEIPGKRDFDMVLRRLELAADEVTQQALRTRRDQRHDDK